MVFALAVTDVVSLKLWSCTRWSSHPDSGGLAGFEFRLRRIFSLLMYSA